MSAIAVLGARNILIENVVTWNMGETTTPAIDINSAGASVQVVDCTISNGGGIYMDAGDGSTIRGCVVTEPAAYGIHVEGPTGSVVVADNAVVTASRDTNTAGMIIDGDGNGTRDVVVTGNHVDSEVDGVRLADVDGIVFSGNTIRSYGRGLDLNDVNDGTIVGNNIAGFAGIDIELTEHGIVLTDSSDNVVSDNVVTEPGQGTDNTYDGIRLAGDSNRNKITDNAVRPSQAANATRYGINISASTCDDNVVADNMLGPTATYGTGAYNNAGTGTVTTRDANGQFTW